jgi:hypothetical protein
MVTQSDKTNTAVVATIVVVGALAMISISALLTTMVRSATAEVDEVRPTHADLDTIAALDKQQLAALHAPSHWVDKPAGKIGIPIERAMQLVVADFRKDPSAASPPIPPGLVLPPTPPADGTAATLPGTAAPPGAAPGATAAPGTAAAPGTTPPAAAATQGVAAPAPGAAPTAAAPAKPISPGAPPSVNAPPPSGAAPSAAPGPAAPTTPPVPAARKL